MKITYEKVVEEEAARNCFLGTNKIHRLWSIFWAEMKCHFYLLWGSIARGECLFIGYGPNGKRSIIGTVTGSLFDGNLQLRRIFWCQNKG
jgi:hypothetical protein